MRKWILEIFPYFVLVGTFLLAVSFLFHPYLQQYWSSFFPDFVATVLGVLMGASLTLLGMIGRQKGAHNKFIRDTYAELKKNSNLLDSHGNILNTDIWDSGISSGSILSIDSKELGELSDLYHQIETNVYEAKICRQASLLHDSLPGGAAKIQARKHWNGLSNLLREREPKLKKRIEDFLKEDFWEKFGVEKESPEV